ncbi:uncharacterized protein TNCV_46291 [Trichonephila clavipes]|nr:uncharacterized protein TNCV_46291 [Trichonephila clavipes]
MDSLIKEFSARFSQFKELSETFRIIMYPDEISFDKLNLSQFDWLEIEELEMQLIDFQSSSIWIQKSTDSMAGEAVSLHSLLANRNCKIYRQNFEADDFPSGAVDLFKGGRANSWGILLLLRLPEKPSTAGSALATRGHPFRRSPLLFQISKYP